MKCHALKLCKAFSKTVEDVYGSEPGNLLDLPDADVDLLLHSVAQPSVQPLQDGRGLVLPGADDEGEPEPLPVLSVVTAQPPQLGLGQEAQPSLSLLPGRLWGQEVGGEQASSQVRGAAEKGDLQYYFM